MYLQSMNEFDFHKLYEGTMPCQYFLYLKSAIKEHEAWQMNI